MHLEVMIAMLTRWNPFSEALSMRDAMDRLFSEPFARSGGPWSHTAPMAYFPFDVYESGDEVFVRAAIPGADPNQIELVVNQGVLTIKGYRGLYSGDQEKQYTWHVRGLPEGNFQFAVSLPTAVNSDAAEANYENGVLTITLPKAETVKSKRIAVKGAQAPQQITAGTQ